jgi:putative membrane protein
VPRHLHPVTPALDLVVQLRQLAIPLVIIAIGGARGNLNLVTIVTILGMVLGYRILAWSRYTYRIDDGALHIEEGVLQRTKRTVPLARIQQVDVQRALRHRAAGVCALRIDTAGGTGGAEATLDVVGLDEAARLRQVLLAARPDPAPTARPAAGTDGPGPAAYGEDDGVERARSADPAHRADDATTDEPDEVLLRISAARLAIGGLTGARLLAVVAVAGSALQLIDDVPEGFLRRLVDALPDGSTGALLLAVIGLPLWLVVAAGSAMLTDGGFTLTRRRGAVHVRRGVLDQREATVGLHRVQAVRISQNPLRRALGLAQVQLQSAGSGTSASGDVTRVTIPVVSTAELDRIVGEVLPGAAPLPDLVPAPPRARRRALLRRIVPVMIIAGPVVALTWPDPAPAIVAGGALAAAAGLGELFYRGLGHASRPGHVTARRGSLVRETVVVPTARTQSARLRSSPMQRRAGLATLLVDVAGRGRTPAIIDGPARRLGALRRDVLDAPAARADEAAVRRRARQHAA